MEQRQPNESNQPRNTPSNGSKPDVRPAEAQSQPQSYQRTGNQRHGAPFRDNRNGNNTPENDPANRPERSQKPGQNQRENRQQNGRPEEQRQKNQQNQRENRPENRQPNPNQRPNEARQRDDNRPNREQTPPLPRVQESLLGEATLRDISGHPNQSAEHINREDRLVIGISLGDYNGIGPEVILKALQYNRLQRICTPVIYGSMRILNRYRNLLNFKDWNLNGAQSIGQISHKLTNVITCWPDQNQDIQPGRVTPEAGQAAFSCLQRAVDDLKAGKLDALVTAPINKYNIQSEEFKFPGHTEYLAQEFGVQDNLMFMVSGALRVGVVTGHIPLGRVRQSITRERIAQKLALMMTSLRQDFGIKKPRIAVLGLNPHAGEEGLLGNEEQEIINPLLADLLDKGELVFGPYPADGFFGTRAYKHFDAVLAMYHDQGLIPFKSIAFEEGVNFTAGMPAIRTSPDHGTAYDIAGKNLADETSMLQAIYTAIDVARHRKEYLELEAGALK
ncbi:4-hydroxythreonine-4-phosphate dehydrogenase PdxA [Spirosoma gilvum]